MAAEDSDIQLAEPIGSGSHQAGDPDAPATAGGTPVLIHLLAPLVYVLACAVLLVADLSVTDGTFTYVLDDAYIHLSLAENVAQGHYGLNPDEPASPSSSVLWPLVLAPFAGAEGFDRIPLVLNLICCILFLISLQRFLFFLAGPSSDRARAGIAVLVACLVFAFNLPGLTFTGMEHSLQILCAAGVVAGLVRGGETGRITWWFAACIVLGPLVRFELLAPSLAALVFLFLLGRRMPALLMGGAVLVGVGGFAWFLVSLRLPPVPNAVLLKLGTEDPLDLWGRISASVKLHEVHVLFGMAGVMLALACVQPRILAHRTLLCLFGAAVIVAHILVGRFGWFDRYEVYLAVMGVMVLLALTADGFRSYVHRVPLYRQVLIAVLLSGTFFPGYVTRIADVTAGARNVYEQQFQMGRFLREFYPRRVAANDMGLTTWRNDLRVLDLFGLASHDAWVHWRDGNRNWIGHAVRRHGSEAVLIYDRIFQGQIPETWTKVAELSLGGRRVTASYDTVAFYAPEKSHEQALRGPFRVSRRRCRPESC